MNKITFAPVQSSEWTSPASGQTYYKEYTITLRSDQKKYNADFTFSLLRENSEIYVEGQNPRYEGMGTIQGTLGGKKVSGGDGGGGERRSEKNCQLVVNHKSVGIKPTVIL